MNFIDNPDGNRVDFNDISLESLGGHILSGDISEETVKPAINFIIKANQLFEGTRDLNLFINTGGGECYPAFGLIDIMEISRLPIKTIGLGSIMSMGVLILCAGEKGKRVMTKNTQVMAHQFFGGQEGKFHEVVSSFKADLYLEQQFLHHFKRHTSMSEKQIKDIVFGPSNRWLTPAECKRYGIVDKVVDALPDFSLHLSAPVPQLRASVSNRQVRK
jgi:ATP-dependent Clp protease protease subunit